MNEQAEAKKFGHNIALLRKELDISQEELSFRCNINRTYMGEIERGEKNPSLITILKIANGLNIPKSKLFDYE